MNARMTNRTRRRIMLKDIIDNFIELYKHNDTELERIKLIKLNNIRMDTLTFLNWIRAEHRECHDSYIYTKDSDDAEMIERKKQVSIK